MRVKNLVGSIFGRLTVVERAENTENGCTRWVCMCSCGNPKPVVVLGSNLRGGNTRSCGCLAQEMKRSRRQSNEYVFFDDYVVGYTIAGIPFYFDIEDYDRIKRYCWHENAQGYICGRVNGKDITLHRFLMSTENGDVVDHINHDGKDNRKSNLRCVTQSRNMQNSKLSKANRSGITGVSWYERDKKWRASITVNYKAYNLGTYDTIEEAATARKKAEEFFFGEHSYEKSLDASPVIGAA